jgi:hypothetical protein
VNCSSLFIANDAEGKQFVTIYGNGDVEGKECSKQFVTIYCNSDPEG